MFKVGQFAVEWAQTHSDYDNLVARAFDPKWASKHRPVISRNRVHTLYTGYLVTQPDGMLIICPYDCGVENLLHTVKGHIARLRCLACNSTCNILRVPEDRSTVLGRQEIVKVEFPQPVAAAPWLTATARARLGNTHLPPPQPLQPVRHRPAPSTQTMGPPPPPPIAPVVATLPAPPPTQEQSGRPAKRRKAAKTPDVVATPPPSPSPSPARSISPALAPQEKPRPTIKIPPPGSKRRPHPSHQSPAPPIMRSQSAPEQQDRDIVMDILPLNKFPTVYLTTDPKKIRKRK